MWNVRWWSVSTCQFAKRERLVRTLSILWHRTTQMRCCIDNACESAWHLHANYHGRDACQIEKIASSAAQILISITKSDLPQRRLKSSVTLCHVRIATPPFRPPWAPLHHLLPLCRHKTKMHEANVAPHPICQRVACAAAHAAHSSRHW